ncbi:hypothetical protein CEUSTIGMA_g288.t1 [Chlamydomonas eustigma]|uniref:polyribonucleotide nucleotidyltransferase n=1 Tax=Chlamydomonas eustigma TaxID=1157962 RepID=A0A250WPT8_9CHLO|nr:hypothetical protein CEUSTIGMA_g288.t1 [Chlamydomonas eustigma]|eukprot:GAX72833.1 hypothetical protein CEUSTIGMA_g288.t1 [Chlamydomonas eustigma]
MIFTQYLLPVVREIGRRSLPAWSLPFQCLSHQNFNGCLLYVAMSVEIRPFSARTVQRCDRDCTRNNQALQGRPFSSAPNIQFGRPIHSIDITLNDSITTIRLESTAVASHANQACMASCGHSHVLATVVAKSEMLAMSEEYSLPLQVDYTEGAYARGLLTHAYSERVRSADQEALSARAIDRAIRPLFPPGYCTETHICAEALSTGGPMDVNVLALNAVSAALMCSSIPWAGPVGAVCVIRGADGSFQLGTSQEDMGSPDPVWARGSNDQVAAPPRSDTFKLLYAGTADKVVMLELEGQEVSEAELESALGVAQTQVQSLIEGQLLLSQTHKRVKQPLRVLGASQRMEEAVKALAEGPLTAALGVAGTFKNKAGWQVEKIKAMTAQLLRERGFLESSGSEDLVPAAEVQEEASEPVMTYSQYYFAFEAVLSDVMRTMALRSVCEGGSGDSASGNLVPVRVDGRSLDELRIISCNARPFHPSRLHGASLFSRGETQSLCLVTVGAPEFRAGSDLLIRKEPLQPNQQAELTVQYQFPPYSTGDTGKLSQRPNRREIGHGALAQRALQAVMPDMEDFSFLVRLVSKTTGSNGSSSMAAVCGGSLALKAAQVPIKGLVAAISVGLVTEHWPRPRCGLADQGWAQELKNYGRHALLLDIQGMEDGLGDMDFKIAGTQNGITAMQLDTKLPGLPLDILLSSVALARKAHCQILATMAEELKRVEETSDPNSFPKHKIHKLQEDVLPALMGDGGRNYLSLQERTCAAISLWADGEVQIYAPDEHRMKEALRGVRAAEGTDLEEGNVYKARVYELLDYGAILEMTSGVRHLLHISEVSHTKIKDIRDVLQEGQVIHVKCLGYDHRGLLKLSYKSVFSTSPDTQSNDK